MTELEYLQKIQRHEIKVYCSSCLYMRKTATYLYKRQGKIIGVSKTVICIERNDPVFKYNKLKIKPMNLACPLHSKFRSILKMNF